MGRFVRLLTLLAVVVLLPTAVYAQASIGGLVRDASNAVVPGVTVEAASPALIEKVRTTTTDSDGRYRIVDLRPGTYTVTFTLAGFSTVKREGIELSGSASATVNADLRVGTVEETVTVTDVAPTVDVQTIAQQRVIGKTTLDTLPTGRTTTNAAVLVPGVILNPSFSGETQDVGGNTGDVMQSLSIHGGATGDTRRSVDGLSTQALGSDSSAFAPNANMVQEVVVDVAAGSAETSSGGVRINIIPRDGGNKFSGSFFAGGTTENLQSDNIDQTLRDRNLGTTPSVTKVKTNWEINPGFGGPIVRDRLWFFSSGRVSKVINYIGGSARNANASLPASDPRSFQFAPDPGFQGHRDTQWTSVNGRVTWQANPKNKISVFMDAQDRCSCIDTRSLASPESLANNEFPWKRYVTLTYTSPVTSRILIEAGFGHKPEDSGYYQPTGGNDAAALPGITELTTGVVYHGPRQNFGTSMRWHNELVDDSWRAAVSYVTGAHTLKVGYQDHVGTMDMFYHEPVAGNLSYAFLAGRPSQITQRSPYETHTNVHDGGVFAQDRWTVGRLTANVGVRWDFYRTNYPTQTLGPNEFTPNRNVTFPAGDVASFNDITPKLGVAYDLFGNGRTALKFSLSKYVQQMTYSGTFGESATPAARTVQAVTRTWNDTNGDFVPQCDLLNLQANGECLTVNNLAYGNPTPSTTYDDDIVKGWGKRFSNWETSVSIQHELVKNLSVDVGYFRRWFGNFLVTDNRAVAASDFTQFSVRAPVDGRLPDGGGQTITGLYNVNRNVFPDNFLTFASNYGKQVQNWQGIDVNVNARLRPGLVVQGGMSTGRTLTDNCEIMAKLPEIQLTGFGPAASLNPFCRIETPYLTQMKLLSAYTIPRIDVQVGGTFQSIPGPQVQANVTYTSADVRPSLGRDLVGGSTVQVGLIQPGTTYGDRLNQVDFRIGKIIRFAGTRTALNIDLFNAFNNNAVVTENAAFVLFRQPINVLNPRLVKFSVQLDF